MDFILDILEKEFISNSEVQPGFKIDGERFKDDNELWQARRDLYISFINGSSYADLAEQFKNDVATIQKEVKFVEACIAKFRNALFNPNIVGLRLVCRVEKMIEEILKMLPSLKEKGKFSLFFNGVNQIQNLISNELKLLKELGVVGVENYSKLLHIDGIPIDQVSTEVLSRHLYEQLEKLGDLINSKNVVDAGIVPADAVVKDVENCKEVCGDNDANTPDRGGGRKRKVM